jgi:DMSO/TMAO reductase YedYZ molybdopterin-dependent catalytic subunit
MKIDPSQVAAEHIRLTRRYFLQIVGTGVATASTVRLCAAQLHLDLPKHAMERLDYLTRDGEFGSVERGDPLPYAQPEAKLREIGMTRDTWKLEVVPDAATGSKVEAPLTRERGTALDWPGLMKLAEKRAVRYLKVITCNNLNSPLGMGLWEGVPLREVVWMTRPVTDIRRVYYYGHHNEDPKQMFRSSLSLSRVLEDPPGEYPVILAYKLNGEFLSGKRGGPVRMIVPEAYGFKSVKWLQRVVLTNLPGANDTYADEDNDIDSWMKTYARFLTSPAEVRVGEAIPITGVAQVGVGGLSKVQYWLHRHDVPLPPGDPYFTTAPWRDAQMLAAPSHWGGGLPEDRIPTNTLGFDPQTHQPKTWPLRYSIVHWAMLLRDVPPGSYDLRCRTIDANGIAQPMPRPLPHSGINSIDQTTLTVKRA